MGGFFPMIRSHDALVLSPVKVGHIVGRWPFVCPMLHPLVFNLPKFLRCAEFREW